MARLLIVDDEWNMRNLLRLYLAPNQFTIQEASDGDEAIRLFEAGSFDLIILDVMMPKMDGWEVCKKIRETSRVPILMLTARNETRDKVHGLNLGADDYLIKPFQSEELVARVSALLRRAGYTDTDIQSVIQHGNMIINPEGRQVIVADQVLELTPKEFDLIHILSERPGRVFSREMLLDLVWGNDYFGDFRTVDTHVKNIRLKTKKAGLSFLPIQTVWGVGYKFTGPEETQ